MMPEAFQKLQKEREKRMKRGKISIFILVVFLFSALYYFQTIRQEKQWKNSNNSNDDFISLNQQIGR